MFRKRSAIQNFRTTVLAEFAFLLNEFGFAEERVRRPHNEFSVWFVNATTRIIVEGINWGGSARAAFGSPGPPALFEDFDLLDFVAIRCPDRMPADDGSLPGQPQQLKVLATLLQECGGEILQGDFSTAVEIREIRKRRLDEWHRQEAERGRPRPPRGEQ